MEITEHEQSIEENEEEDNIDEQEEDSEDEDDAIDAIDASLKVCIVLRVCAALCMLSTTQDIGGEKWNKHGQGRTFVFHMTSGCRVKVLC